ncbi:hypothetical protein [Streptomyces sp. NPDC005476]|uniref:hypothetical protein n=1 Tax=Streptomyces sp. NPDC005476 TaxID=3156882 RepID=UPI0034553B24
MSRIGSRRISGRVFMEVVRHVCAGALLLCGAWLGVRELGQQASGRGGKRILLALGFALCAAGVLISQT